MSLSWAQRIKSKMNFQLTYLSSLEFYGCPCARTKQYTNTERHTHTEGEIETHTMSDTECGTKYIEAKNTCNVI